jgi:molecular chaperone GrpE
MSENEKLNEMVENKLEKVEEDLIEKLTKEKEELTEHLRRLKAEFENFKKDALRDREMILKNANEYLLTKLIPVLDDLERAFSAVEHGATYEDFYKGMRLIYKKLWKLLNDEGLFKIEVGQKFDPFEHEAVERIETEEKEEYDVLEVVESGYKYHSKVLKPTKVKVAVKPSRGENSAQTV